MGLFGPKVVVCPAGVWTTIISNSFVQMPKEFEVKVTSASGDAIEGLFEEKKSSWIFPNKPTRGSIGSRMTFHRGYFNTFYSVKLCPTTNCTVEVD